MLVFFSVFEGGNRMLTVVKSLNNNIILAVNKVGNELVAFGTGIGFKRKKGDQVPMEEVTKVFQSGMNHQASRLLEGLSPELLSVTEKMISLGENKLNLDINSSLLFTLADHLRYAIERKEQKIDIDTPFQWEIPHLYFKEYEIGIESLQLIQIELGIELPTTEASFIALHFVNAQMDNQSMNQTIRMTTLTKDIVKIIQACFNINLDKTTMTYSRFITHLRYFIARQESEKLQSAPMDSTLKTIIQERYSKSYECGLMIKDMLLKVYGWQISEDELVYLVIHIERIIK
ncbi:transcriptional antiterminator [Carnobacterium maltaromaticum]|nr:transcriptional antiterminator [Carnobacterium maltaromaticum]